MGYCPLWVLSVVSAHATRQYVNGHVPLLSYATQYSEILSGRYEGVSKRKLMAIAEDMMTFLVEVDADNILDIFDSFIYYKVTVDESGEPRKIKTLFKSAFSAVGEDPGVDDIVKSFKIFTYRYRSNEAIGVPAGWQLQDVEKIDWLGDLFDVQVSFSGSLGLD